MRIACIEYFCVKQVTLKQASNIILFFAFAVFVSCNDGSTTTIEKDTVIAVKPSDKLIDLSKSTNIEKVLCQGWELEDDLEALSSSSGPEGILPFRSFYFSPDFTFVRNPRNAIELGKWQFDKETKTITLNYNSGSKDVYKIAALAPAELKLVNTGINSQTVLKFVSDGKAYKNVEDDPYYIANNTWRIKPKKAESDSLLRKRLKEYLHFHILFYRDNLAREKRTISFYGFPTCLKWYAGGIFMIKKDELPENWFTCFYNKEQAFKAYEMISALLDKKYKWSKEKISWVKKNLEVLEQMYGNL